MKKKSDTPSQINDPIKYPAIPPITEAVVAMAAKMNDREGEPRHSTMRRGSVGIGKNDDSAIVKIMRAGIA